MKVNRIVRANNEVGAALKATEETMPSCKFDCEIKDDSYVIQYDGMSAIQIPEDEAMRLIGAPQFPGLRKEK